MENINMDAHLRESFFYHSDTNEKVPVCPLMLAVSGHRHIAPNALNIVRKRTYEFFLKTGIVWRKKQRPASGKCTPAPILVLCGMASGADSLAAEEVLRLKREKPELNYKLAAVLPMPQEIYEEDFSEGTERNDFLRLYAEADYRIALPLVPEAQRWRDAHPEESLPLEFRILQYEELGKYLAANSLYLLALWDGIEAEREECEPFQDADGRSAETQTAAAFRGGTADVVRMKTEGVVSENSMPIMLKNFPHNVGIGAVQPVGSVFQIVTPRIKHGNLLLAEGYEPGDIWVYSPVDGFQVGDEVPYRRRKISNLSRYFIPLCPLRLRLGKKVLAPFNESATFNRDSCWYYSRLSKDRAQSEQYLLGSDLPRVSENIHFMTEHYANADALALYFQTLFFKIAKCYLLIGVLFALTFYGTCYCTPFAENLPAVTGLLGIVKQFPSFMGLPKLGIYVIDIVYLVLLAALLTVFLFNSLFAFYERYHRYRTLAEILRVQIFWNLAGIHDDAFNHYWNHQIMKLNWLRFTARSILMTVTPDPESDFEIVRNRWVTDQFKYFSKKIRTYNRSDSFWNRLGTFFMFFAILWFIVRIFVMRLAVVNSPLILSFYVTAVLFLAMCGMGSVCCFVWNRLKSNGSLVHRYSKIAPIYHQAVTTLQRIARYEANGEMPPKTADENRRLVLCYLGEAALAENADWFLMTRKLELPK